MGEDHAGSGKVRFMLWRGRCYFGGGGQTPIGYHKLQAFGSREPKDAVHRVDGLERYN
jgi:hypothetical protein